MVAAVQLAASRAGRTPTQVDTGARSARFGWEILTKVEGAPLAGVGSVSRGPRADPPDGTAWQDASPVDVERLASLFR